MAAGWLSTERHGRRSRVHLTPETAAMLRAGTERIYSFGEPWTWDGRWLLVVLRVPEERREVRHQLRTRLAWAGFGSLGGGLWISPHVERERELHDVLRAGSVADVLSFHAEIGDVGDPLKVVAEAWDLDRVSEAYRDFIARFGRLRPSSPEAIFRAQTQLVHEWRRFPFLDPDLPADMLPARWPRKRAHDVFDERHAQWHERRAGVLQGAGGDRPRSRRRGEPRRVVGHYHRRPSHYTRGKFSSDGHFDSTLVSQQCGAGVLLRALVDGGQVIPASTTAAIV